MALAGTVAGLFVGSTSPAFLAVLTCLGLAATSRHSYRRTRAGSAGALGLVGLDAAALTVLLLVTPAPAWPLFAAVPLSLGRIALVVTRLPSLLGDVLAA